MKILSCLFALLLLTAGCSKADRDQPDLVAWCPGGVEPAWVTKIKSDNGSCICLTGLRMGMYQSQPVYELYLFDPACLGINIIYHVDGSVWFTSQDQVKYTDYWASLTDIYEYWKCSRN